MKLLHFIQFDEAVFPRRGLILLRYDRRLVGATFVIGWRTRERMHLSDYQTRIIRSTGMRWFRWSWIRCRPWRVRFWRGHCAWFNGPLTPGQPVTYHDMRSAP